MSHASLSLNVHHVARVMTVLALWAVLAYDGGISHGQSTSASLAKQEAHMRTGTVDESFAYRALVPGASFVTEAPVLAKGDMLLLRIVIPDDREGHGYSFALHNADGIFFKRSGNTSGFGRRSFLIPWNGTNATPVRVENLGPQTLCVEELRPVAEFAKWANQPIPPNDFHLGFLMNRGIEGKPQLFDWLRVLPDVPGIAKTASLEVYYARVSPQHLREDLAYLRIMCELNGLQALAIPCSWWAGTPPEVLQRPEFQQVCWSPTDNSTSGAKKLNKLFGREMDVRYGFTVPNMWSNTPWQTMNNPELNKLRHERLRKAIEIIEEQLDGILVGHVAENEPAYWAWEAADYHYPVRRSPLYADFNPFTVADAKKDGVELDPTDGLDLKERRWFHFNAARYVQNTINVYRDAKASGMIFSHALLDQMFPMEGTGYFHPYAEIARVHGARVGLETVYRADFDGLWRTREWGHWACVNREENDGVALEHHVAMLQLEYALGADLFNSYNWDAINENNRSVLYFKEFMDSAAAGHIEMGSRAPADAAWQDLQTSFTTPLAIRAAYPWANELQLTMKPPATGGHLHVWLSAGVGGDVASWATIRAKDIPASGSVSIDFGDLATFRSGQTPVLNLSSTTPGWQVLAGTDGIQYSLRCNLKNARRRSQYVIHEAALAGK